MRILDVGTGLSKIKERLPECKVTTHEMCEDCPADIHGPLGNVNNKSYDAVTCFDVIEHVKDYGMFTYQMVRIAKQWLFITTPGALTTLNANPCHFHEFHPWELIQLVEATGHAWFHEGWAQEWEGPARYDGVTPLNLLTGVIKATKDELLTKPFLHPIAALFEIV